MSSVAVDAGPPVPRDLLDLLGRFGGDFNAGRVERMADYYVEDFAAVVDGAFVERALYLARTAQLLAAGVGDIDFQVRHVCDLTGGAIVADGTTIVADADGRSHRSLFSILCVRDGGSLKFAHTHSSSPKAPA